MEHSDFASGREEHRLVDLQGEYETALQEYSYRYKHCPTTCVHVTVHTKHMCTHVVINR